jgi:nicotinamidase/pyrazinamidase
MRVDRSKDALLIVDVQRDFLPGGSLAVAEGEQILRGLARVTELFETVVATQDFHPRGHVSFASSHPGRGVLETVAVHGAPQMLWPDHCVAGTAGAALAPEVPDDALTLILRKGTRRHIDSYSAFREQAGPDGRRTPTGLAAWLRARGVSRVFVVGLARNYCVRATAVDAAAEGFETIVVEDLTKPVAPQRRAETDEAWREAGVRVVCAGDLSGDTRDTAPDGEQSAR